MVALDQLKAAVRKSGKYHRGAEEDGTHSILDINKASTKPVSAAQDPGFGAVAPLPDSELVRLFGAARPEHAAVVEHADELQAMRHRWTGVIVVVYRDGAPSELFFTGFSGD